MIVVAVVSYSAVHLECAVNPLEAAAVDQMSAAVVRLARKEFVVAVVL